MVQQNGQHLVSDAEKAAGDDQAIRKSVIQQPATGNLVGSGGDLIYLVSQAANGMIGWGHNTKIRDRQLRQFWPTENVFASALQNVAARNAAFSWSIKGPPRTSSRVHDILENANFGEGWLDLVEKVSIDLYTQDSGSFIEIVRETDSEKSPAIGINHLDAGRCWHTGDWEIPVIYEDIKGVRHKLKWYQVATLSEMPTPIETLRGLQYSALTRLLLACQVVKNINTYKDEKTSGRHTRALHIVRGVSTQLINQAMAQNQIANDNEGLTRFSLTPMIGTIDPAVELQHLIVDMVSLPDNYNEETSFKYYIAMMALAFGVDYQEFAPLPGGNLGTASQSEVQHSKARGKGPATFMKLISHFLNQRVLPDNCEFIWEEQDISEEEQRANLKKLRAEGRQVRIQSGEITPEIARQIAHDEGDLEEEYLKILGGADVTPDVTLEDDRPTEAQIANDNPNTDTIPQGKPPITAAPATLREPGVLANLAKMLTRSLPEGEKTRVSDFLQTRIHKAFTTAADDLAALGYMDTDQRIVLSSVIGDALRAFAELVGDKLPNLVERELWDDDIRLYLMEKDKASATDEAIEQVSDDRLLFEDANVQAGIGPILAELQSETKKRLRTLARQERAAFEDVAAIEKAILDGLAEVTVAAAKAVPSNQVQEIVRGVIQSMPPGIDRDDIVAAIRRELPASITADEVKAIVRDVVRGELPEPSAPIEFPEPPAQITREVIRGPDGKIARVVETASDGTKTIKEVARDEDGRIARIVEMRESA